MKPKAQGGGGDQGPLAGQHERGQPEDAGAHYRLCTKHRFKIISYSGLLQRCGIKRCRTRSMSCAGKAARARCILHSFAVSSIEASSWAWRSSTQLANGLYGPLLDSEKSWRSALSARREKRCGQAADLNTALQA